MQAPHPLGASWRLPLPHLSPVAAPALLSRARPCPHFKPSRLLLAHVSSPPSLPPSFLPSFRSAAADAFVGRLLSIYRAVLAEGITQPAVLGIHRSDYMIDVGADGSKPPALRQIEINTVSSAFAGLSHAVAATHAYAVGRLAAPSGGDRALLASALGPAAAAAGAVAATATPDETLAVLAAAGPAGEEKGASSAPRPSFVLPANLCLNGAVDGIAAAHAHYCATLGGGAGAPVPVVAFVVQASERNVMDQRLLEHALWERHGIASRRVTLQEVAATGVLRQGDRALLLPDAPRASIEGRLVSVSPSAAAALAAAPPSAGGAPSHTPVSVVYFRCGYVPADFPEEACWDARLLLERSAAVKCPNVAYQLAGCKKVQQALALPGAVERFLPAHEATALRACFAGLWSLDAAEGGAAHSPAVVADALSHPAGYVMKPQREGGGNNLYGPDVATALSSMPPDALAAYILMERVFPASSPGLFMRAGVVSSFPAVSEMGVYGVYCSSGVRGAPPLVNAAVGHLLRTKAEGTDEGGVAAGFAVLDSPLLVVGQ